MLKKTIKFLDHAGNQKEQEFYFNLTRAEALEINLIDGLETVSKSTDPRTIIPVFKHIIGYAVGKRTRDDKFVKSPEIAADFLASDAYSELFLDLLDGDNSENKVAAFITALVPQGVEPDRRAQPQDHKKAETPDFQRADLTLSENAETLFAPAPHETGQGFNDVVEPPKSNQNSW